MNTNKAQAEKLTQDAVIQSVLKQNDCRYGNYIIYGGSITQLNEKEMCHFFRFPETYKPIPLTEEWLQKLGFELKGFYRLKVTSFLELCWKPHDNTLNLQTEKNGFTEDSKCKYVHQLQNLYFAFTQRELTVA